MEALHLVFGGTGTNRSLCASEKDLNPTVEAALIEIHQHFYLCAVARGLVLEKIESADILRWAVLGASTSRNAAINMGILANIVRVRLHRVRKALKRALLKHCGARAKRACLDCNRGDTAWLVDLTGQQ